MADDVEVEALADSIAGCFSNVSDLPEWMRVQALGRYMRPLSVLAARAVLDSDWLAARLQAARADDAARLAEVERLATEMCAFDIVDMPVPDSVDVPDDYELAVNDYGRMLWAALGVTAPTASEAGDHRPVRDRNGSDGSAAIGCSCGASTCDWDGFLEHIRTAPAEAPEVEGSDRG